MSNTFSKLKGSHTNFFPRITHLKVQMNFNLIHPDIKKSNFFMFFFQNLLFFALLTITFICHLLSIASAPLPIHQKPSSNARASSRARVNLSNVKITALEPKIMTTIVKREDFSCCIIRRKTSISLSKARTI